MKKALENKAVQAKELEHLQREVLSKRGENELARGKNAELKGELEILEKYALQLQDNLADMMKDFKQQFEGLTSTVEHYNADIDKLRSELTQTQGSYFDLKSKQHVLESEVEALRIRRELTIGLNEERRLQQLKVSILDSDRRSAYLESEVQVVLERWQGKVALVRKAVLADSEHREAEVLSELTEKYMATIF